VLNLAIDREVDVLTYASLHPLLKERTERAGPDTMRKDPGELNEQVPIL
jgi:hypothetical protein